MHCPTVKRNRAAQNEASRPKKSEMSKGPDWDFRGPNI